MKTTVWFTTSFIGFHHWPNAPLACNHLRHMHRHVFNVKVEMYVAHNDRDIEFQIAKMDVDVYLSESIASRMALIEKSTMSCEQIAERIWAHCAHIYVDNPIKCITVDEDGECGATIYAE